ncbi:PLP-dependent aminotransferase family protein [Salinicola halimionae]|uniref:MocR-like pyridoxine biosynthesis transcription factor PdxR n=1 Tax=Salinicola halimionae TaxID=1949081 RepID=UPI000DA12F98|nr:PLP-dependent aminotransferase family protein [Salinicola halimionae]
MSKSHAHRLWIIEALEMRLASPSTLTLTQRLYQSLRDWIQDGALGTGSALPSSRHLARELGLGRNTVLGAIDRLTAEGFVEARPGAGVFVAEWRAGAMTEALPESDAAATTPELSTRGQRILDFSGVLTDRHTAFAPGVPALDQFPRERWQRLLRRHHQRAPLEWHDYQQQGGVPALREALCDYLRLSRSVRCRPEQILITQGAQQGFELIARLLADVGETVWMEEPGYGGAHSCFVAAGLKTSPLEVDSEGARAANMSTGLSSPRLIYVTPSHQYPSGVTMTLPRRMALLEAARRYAVWIIEDDYDSEFRYASAPIASLQGLVDNGPVIYVGTFSKVLYPGLRLGYLVLPEALVEPFKRANARLHREGQYVAQSALAEFIAEGYFVRHVSRMRELYRRRQANLRHALAPAIALGLKLSSGQAGMHLVAELGSLELETTLVTRGREAGILLSPLSRYYSKPPGKPGLVLGYAGATETEIASAGRWLSDAWCELSCSDSG